MNTDLHIKTVNNVSKFEHAHIIKMKYIK